MIFNIHRQIIENYNDTNLTQMVHLTTHENYILDLFLANYNQPYISNSGYYPALVIIMYERLSGTVKSQS